MKNGFLARNWCWLAVCLSGTLGWSCGTSRRDDLGQTAFERGTSADARLRVCKGYILSTLSAEDSLSTLVTQFPDAYEPGVDCLLDAKSCDEVSACETSAFATRPRIQDLPECGNVPTDHCDGNVLKRCATDDDLTYYEVSYDCSLAGATCVEGVEAGRPWVDCKASEALCAGQESHCEGTRAVICREHPVGGYVNAAVYNCNDVFGSTCAERDAGGVDCEGPAVGEVQCHDALDNDNDGTVDCDDTDCTGACALP